MTAPPFYSKTLDFSLSYIICSIALSFFEKAFFPAQGDIRMIAISLGHLSQGLSPFNSSKTTWNLSLAEYALATMILL